MLASFHMEGEALIQFQDSEETWVFYDQESLIQTLHVRFGSTAYDDPMETLIRLRQTVSVALYMAQFEVISNRIKGLSSSHKLSYFFGGLKNKIRLPFRMLNPQLLEEAFGLSRIQVEYNQSCKKNSKIQLEQGKPSILDLPKVASLIDPKTRCLLREFHLHKQRKERKKDYAITVLRSGLLVISARMLCCFFLIILKLFMKIILGCKLLNLMMLMDGYLRSYPMGL